MKADDPWALLQAGKIEEGLRPFAEAHARKPTPSHIMELGVAYLWAKRYEAAWEHFRMTNEAYPKSGSGFYGMAGAAKWCLGDPSEAVRQWSNGLKSRYADTNGLGMHLPLLLFMASVLKPEYFARDAAVKLLREKAKDRRANEWPGPIARWVLGEINEGELRERCADDDKVETWDQHWLADFYQGVLWHGDGKHAKFKETMRKLADTTLPEWSDETFFLARMWSEEFFIARHEAS